MFWTKTQATKKPQKKRQEWMPFVPEELSDAARALWPDREAMPSPESVKNLVQETRKDPALRLEVLSWLRRTAVPRGPELFGLFGGLMAVVALVFSLTDVAPVIAISIAVLVGVGMLWLLVKSAGAVLHLGERSRHATAWLRAFEDALLKESKWSHWRRGR